MTTLLQSSMSQECVTISGLSLGLTFLLNKTQSPFSFYSAHIVYLLPFPKRNLEFSDSFSPLRCLSVVNHWPALTVRHVKLVKPVKVWLALFMSVVIVVCLSLPPVIKDWLTVTVWGPWSHSLLTAPTSERGTQESVWKKIQWQRRKTYIFKNNIFWWQNS